MLKLSNSREIDGVLIIKKGFARFMMQEAFLFNGCSKEPSCTWEVQVDEVHNPKGFIVDRLSRMAKHNPSILAVSFEDDFKELTDRFIDEVQTRKRILVGGSILPKDSSVVMMVVDENGDCISSFTKTEDELVQSSGSCFWSADSLVLPKSVDDEGFPRYTRNSRINELLLSAKIPFGDDAKKYTKVFVEKRKFFHALASLAKKEGIDHLSSYVIDAVNNLRLPKASEKINTEVPKLLKKERAFLESLHESKGSNSGGSKKPLYFFNVDLILEFSNERK